VNLKEMVLASRSLPPGSYAECGVFRGDSAVVIADNLPDGADLWLFDSFEGHGEPCKFDDPEHPKGRYKDTKPGDVIARLRTDINVTLVIGYIPHTFRRVPYKLDFRFVHIDVDHYEPTKAACEFFLPRMVPGGIIRFDDYGAVLGATKAIDEVIGRERLLPSDWRLEMPLTSTCKK